MVLEFEVVILRAEDLLEPVHRVARLLFFALEDVVRQLTREAARQSDQALGMLGEQFLVDAWLVVEALQVGRRDQLHEVVVTDLILRQQHEMVIKVPGASAGLLVQPAARRHVNLTAQDGLHAGLLGGLPKLYRAEHHAVISHRHRGKLQCRGLGHQLVELTAGIEQRILRVQVQVDEIGSHVGRKRLVGGRGSRAAIWSGFDGAPPGGREMPGCQHRWPGTVKSHPPILPRVNTAA